MSSSIIRVESIFSESSINELYLTHVSLSQRPGPSRATSKTHRCVVSPPTVQKWSHPTAISFAHNVLVSPVVEL